MFDATSAPVRAARGLSRFVRGVAAALVLAVLAPVAAAQSFENEEYGYRLRLPKEYERANAGFAELGFSFSPDRYLVDSFRSKKGLPLKSGWTYSPRVYALWFPTRTAAEIRKAELEREKEAKDGEPTVLIGAGRIYGSFEEWAKDNITGFYFDSEKEQTLAGYPAKVRTMLFEKLQNEPQRWLSCAYAVPGGEFALVCALPDSHHDKLKNEVMNVFRSFKVTREGGLLVKPLGSNVAVEKTPEIDREKMSPEEIRTILDQERDKAFEKALANLPKDWRSFRYENMLVLHDTDPKYAKQAAQHAETLRAWLEQNFPGIGDGYLQASILRVYKADSSTSFGGPAFRVSFGGGPRVEEIHFRQPTSKGHRSEFFDLNHQVLQAWFSQKNEELWNRLPRWLESGLVEYVEDADRAGAKLRFDPDDWERDQLAAGLKAQEKWAKDKTGEPPLKELEKLLRMTTDEMWDGDNWRYTPSQCGSLMRYLIEGPGTRNPLTKTLLRDYIAHLYTLVADVEKKLKEERDKALAQKQEAEGLSDEERLAKEDEAYREKRKNALDSVEKQILEQAFQKTFADWGEPRWRDFERSWQSYAEGRTR